MIYERIKKLREKQGYTQTELAKMLGVTRSCVNAWEMGISVPSTQSLARSITIILPIRTRWTIMRIGRKSGRRLKTEAEAISAIPAPSIKVRSITLCG